MESKDFTIIYDTVDVQFEKATFKYMLVNELQWLDICSIICFMLVLVVLLNLKALAWFFFFFNIILILMFNRDVTYFGWI